MYLRRPLRFKLGGHGALGAPTPLGVVPVEKDGSVHFKAPVGKAIYFQLLDPNGMAVQSIITDNPDIVFQFDHLNMEEIVDLEGTSCCPDPIYFKSKDKVSWLSVAARNLTLAEDLGLDIVTNCSGCTATLFYALARMPLAEATVSLGWRRSRRRRRSRTPGGRPRIGRRASTASRSSASSAAVA